MTGVFGTNWEFAASQFSLSLEVFIEHIPHVERLQGTVQLQSMCQFLPMHIEQVLSRILCLFMAISKECGSDHLITVYTTTCIL